MRSDNLFRQRIVFALLVIAVTLYPLMATGVSVKHSIKGDNLTVGDRFLYIDTLGITPGDTLQPLSPEDGMLGDATIMSMPLYLKKTPADMEVVVCTLAVFKPGPAKIASFSYRKKNSSDTTEYFGDTLTVNIKSVLPPDTAGLQIADIKEPKRIRGPIWPYIVIPLALAALIYGIILLRKRLRGKIEEPSIPPVPPWELAIQRLEKLKTERHIEFGKFKQFYFELSLIIRGYIEGRYNTPAAESTTYELEDNEILKAIPGELRGNLFNFFVRSDLVKFAKSIPTAKDAEHDIAFAFRFVDETKPTPISIVESVTNAGEVKA